MIDPDDEYCRLVLDQLLSEDLDPTERAEKLSDVLTVDRARRAFARWIISKQVPLVGEVN